MNWIDSNIEHALQLIAFLEFQQNPSSGLEDILLTDEHDWTPMLNPEGLAWMLLPV